MLTNPQITTDFFLFTGKISLKKSISKAVTMQLKGSLSRLNLFTSSFLLLLAGNLKKHYIIGPLSGLRQFLTTESLKMMKNAF